MIETAAIVETLPEAAPEVVAEPADAPSTAFGGPPPPLRGGGPSTGSVAEPEPVPVGPVVASAAASADGADEAAEGGKVERTVDGTADAAGSVKAADDKPAG